ncbi:hypothetical protein HII31_06830 [Pseudocercospora fuligena]|uniref:Uncharacterized protein n=1 Tax=Pseudocercospora fuligena TaxID=685502 RepID=A0A8H6VHJ6_9PEZI|nr:hypothetical protein HII31_06830 [Pseudocercospora fuligena]
MKTSLLFLLGVLGSYVVATEQTGPEPMSYDGHCVKGKCKIKFMGKLHDAGCPEDDQCLYEGDYCYFNDKDNKIACRSAHRQYILKMEK